MIIYHNNWDIIQEKVVKNIKIIIKNRNKKIRNKIKIYPYLGNNEKISLEEYYGSEIIFLNDLDDILKENLSKEVELFF